MRDTYVILFSGSVTDLGDETDVGKKATETLDDFELPDNLTQLLMSTMNHQKHVTPEECARTKIPGMIIKSPYLQEFDSGASDSR